MPPEPAQHGELIRQKLKLKSLDTHNLFAQKYFEAEKLLHSKGVNLGKIREHSSKLIGAGMMSGALLLAQPVGLHYLPQTAYEMEKLLPAETPLPVVSPYGKLMGGLKTILPTKVQPLERSQEKALEKLFAETINVPAKATLEGEHLNTTYGYIGAEQHLRRYPGDVMSADRASVKHDEGMAPGLGAWGYFAPSKEKLTPDLVEAEKWYVVAQTLYLPDWNTRTRYLRDWYKYRKVLVVNTENGKAVIGDIADAGPAAWTGKHFGGSPAVMNHLGGARYKKGAVLFFFVDDPHNEIKLGPVEYNQ
jgi:hypothetical protein